MKWCDIGCSHEKKLFSIVPYLHTYSTTLLIKKTILNSTCKYVTVVNKHHLEKDNTCSALLLLTLYKVAELYLSSPDRVNAKSRKVILIELHYSFLDSRVGLIHASQTWESFIRSALLSITLGFFYISHT